MVLLMKRKRIRVVNYRRMQSSMLPQWAYWPQMAFSYSISYGIGYVKEHLLEFGAALLALFLGTTDAQGTASTILHVLGTTSLIISLTSLALRTHTQQKEKNKKNVTGGSYI